MNVTAELVKAFTTDPDKGNPAGIVHDSRGLTDEQMLNIAHTLNYPETAFVSASDIDAYRVRFFSAQQEVDFCGHATVATFFSLFSKDLLSFKGFLASAFEETMIGTIPITIHEDGKVMMTQFDPTFEKANASRQDIARILGIKATQIADLPIELVSTGSKKLIVPVQSLEALKEIRPDFNAITEFTEGNDIGFSVFAQESFSGNADLATRYFNPQVGIDEDPATGSAGGPLACYADRYIFGGNKNTMSIEQGFDMGCDSTISVDLSKGVKVGGYAVSFGTRELEV